MEAMDNVAKNLDVMFNALREREGVKKGMVCEVIGSIAEYGVLMNRRFKEENNIELSDLEKIVASEEGKFIRMHIAELFYQLKINEQENIPFPQYDISLEELYSTLFNSQEKVSGMKR